MAGETIVTVSGTGFTSVEVWTTKLDHNLDKPIIDIQIPSMPSDVDADKDSITRWETYLIDTGRVKEIITVQGMLYDDSSTSALERKQNLLKMAGNGGGEITITWGTGSNQQSYTGTINKIGFTETAGLIADGGQKSGQYQEKNFTVQFSLMVGTDKMRA